MIMNEVAMNSLAQMFVLTYASISVVKYLEMKCRGGMVSVRLISEKLPKCFPT